VSGGVRVTSFQSTQYHRWYSQHAYNAQDKEWRGYQSLARLCCYLSGEGARGTFWSSKCEHKLTIHSTLSTTPIFLTHYQLLTYDQLFIYYPQNCLQLICLLITTTQFLWKLLMIFMDKHIDLQVWLSVYRLEAWHCGRGKRGPVLQSARWKREPLSNMWTHWRRN